MPKVMMMFEAMQPGSVPERFRLVDRTGGIRSTGDLNAAIERFDGFDALGNERWIDGGPEGVRALLNAIVYWSVEPPSVPSVKEPAA